MGQMRNGKPLTNLGEEHPRRLADFKNAWRKMSPRQRQTALTWLHNENLPVADEGVRRRRRG